MFIYHVVAAVFACCCNSSDTLSHGSTMHLLVQQVVDLPTYQTVGAFEKCCWADCNATSHAKSCDCAMLHCRMR